jgi:hypothetical protein
MRTGSCRKIFKSDPFIMIRVISPHIPVLNFLIPASAASVISVFPDRETYWDMAGIPGKSAFLVHESVLELYSHTSLLVLPSQLKPQIT